MPHIATFYGNGDKFHDAVVGRRGDFGFTLQRLCDGAEAVVGVVRENAFYLDKILAFIARESGSIIEIDPFVASPTRDIAKRFARFLNQLENQAEKIGARVEIKDPELLPLLEKVQALSQTEPEIELLRLLGIVCDTALVGPHWFVFETINACNSDCLYCNIHAPSRTPTRDFLADKLPFAVFASTCDDLAGMGIDGVTLLANGEPLLHPDFSKMAVHAKSKGFIANFFTNGLLMDKNIIRTITDCGVDEVFITISAASEKTYLALHSKQKSGDFQRVKDNLMALAKAKANNNIAVPKVCAVHVICSENYHEVMEMARQAAAFGASKLRLALIRLDDHNRALALTKDHIASLRAGLKELQEYCLKNNIELWDGYTFQLKNADSPEDWAGDTFVENGCFIGWGLGLVKANADLSFCCVVKPLANLRDAGFRETWFGPVYHQARVGAKDLLANGDLTFTDGSCLLTGACRHCDNHDINAMLHRRLAQTGLVEFLR